eukprot:TRINITY_DN2814_c0_g2_i1.p1 TRINITY_DN2814_c0_g2~~TRINITY_DN2814_c0_g2_i1.p1  ORF type:complete len:129 (-),score=56.76 TRINITY_DN2814_c0_g2_i1:548-934(-)
MSLFIRVVSLFCKDYEKAIEFWTNKIGMKLKFDSGNLPNSTFRWIELEFPNHETVFALKIVDQQIQDNEVVGPGHALATDNLEALYTQLSQNGVEFKELPNEVSYGKQAIFYDQDRFTHVIVQRIFKQ